MKCPIIALVLMQLFTGSLSARCLEDYFVPISLQHSSSCLEKIDCIYVINLNYLLDKWEESRQSFESFGLYSNRVEAINGWELSVEEKQELCGNYPLRMRGGHMGCLLSHLSVLRDAKERGFKTIWVCEDDLAFVENPKQVSSLLAKLEAIDQEWDIFYTDPETKDAKGGCLPSLGSDFRPDEMHLPLSYYLQKIVVAKDILRIYQRFGAYSMCISQRGIDKILKYFLSRSLWTAYDVDLHYVPGLREYCSAKDIVTINFLKPSDTYNPPD